MGFEQIWANNLRFENFRLLLQRTQSQPSSGIPTVPAWRFLAHNE